MNGRNKAAEIFRHGIIRKTLHNNNVKLQLFTINNFKGNFNCIFREKNSTVSVIHSRFVVVFSFIRF